MFVIIHDAVRPIQGVNCVQMFRVPKFCLPCDEDRTGRRTHNKGANDVHFEYQYGKQFGGLDPDAE